MRRGGHEKDTRGEDVRRRAAHDLDLTRPRPHPTSTSPDLTRPRPHPTSTSTDLDLTRPRPQPTSTSPDLDLTPPRPHPASPNVRGVRTDLFARRPRPCTAPRGP